jgi:hypothetical protein
VIKTALRQLLEQPNAPLPISVEYRAVASTLVVAITEMVAWDDLGLWWNQAFKELGATFSGHVRTSGVTTTTTSIFDRCSN